MSAPSTLTITLVDSSTVVVTIPTALQSLDSGQTASSQSGYSAADVIVSSIFKRGYFWDSAKQTAYAAAQIKSIAIS